VPLEPREEEVTTIEERDALVAELETRMREAARNFEFEKAAELRDRIKALKNKELFAITE
jgi:excinuclease ABC subunit B